MKDMQTLDITSSVSATVKEVFDTMLSMNVDVYLEKPPALPSGLQFVGSVGFAGEVTGSINLQMNETFAHLLTANMLGMEVDDIESAEEVEDVIGELSNMIGGDLKSRFCDLGLACELTVPSITVGQDFRIEQVGALRCETIGIGYQAHIAQIQVYIK